jgi:Arc/MetJ family transcription regulator
VAAVMRIHRLDSKRSAVDLALRRLVGEPMFRDHVLTLRGKGFDYTNAEVESMSTAEASATE